MAFCTATDEEMEGSVLAPIIKTGDPETDALHQAVLNASFEDFALFAIAMSRKEREESQSNNETTVS